MIPISELRIGNYLNGNYNGFSKDVCIYDFNRNQIKHTDNHQLWLPIDSFKPIPLTEECLKKLGFYEDGETPYNSKYYSICLSDYKYCFAYAGFRGDWGFFQEYTDSAFIHDNQRKHFVSCGIKYLHELQNLWIDLKTGIELTIKL